jgi:AraC-like DNA-binding protein
MPLSDMIFRRPASRSVMSDKPCYKYQRTMTSLPYSYRPRVVPGDFPFWCNHRCIIEDQPIITLHSHNILEIGLCHDGDGIFVVGDKVLDYHPGDVAFVASTEVHHAQSKRGTISTWSILFLDIDRLVKPHFPECIEFDTTRFSGSAFRNILSREAHPEICRSVETIIRESARPGKLHQVLIKSLLAQLVVYLNRLDFGAEAPGRFLRPQSIERLRPAIEQVMTNYMDRLSVAALASRCCMSPRNLDRLFRVALNKSPQQYIMEIRLAMAITRLHSSDDPIAKVALDSGFSTISSFNRMFRSKMNCTPRQWKARAPSRTLTD